MLRIYDNRRDAAKSMTIISDLCSVHSCQLTAAKAAVALTAMLHRKSHKFHRKSPILCVKALSAIYIHVLHAVFLVSMLGACRASCCAPLVCPAQVCPMPLQGQKGQALLPASRTALSCCCKYIKLSIKLLSLLLLMC